MSSILSGSGGGLLGGGGAWPKPKSATSELSPLQQQELLALLAAQPKGRTFWDEVKDGGGDILSPITWALRQISRPGYGIARAALYATDEDPRTKAGEGFKEGFIGAVPTGFGQVLEQNAILSNHDFLRGLSGFGLDVATDPTNLIYIAGAPVTGGASLGALAAKNGMKAGSMKLAIEAGQTAIKKNTAEELTQAYKVLSDPMLAPAFGPQKLLAEKKLIQTYRDKWGASYPDELSRRLDELGLIDEAVDPLKYRVIEATAAASQKKLTRDLNRAQIKWAGVPLTPASKLAPKMPSLSRVAEGESIVNKLPIAGDVLQGAANSVGKTFVGGFTNPVGWAARMTGKHSAERLGDDYVRILEKDLSGFSKMDPEARREAIRYATSAKGIVDKEGTLNEDMLNEVMTTGWVRNAGKENERAFKLDQEQVEYIRAVHGYGKKLADYDDAYGVKYKDGTVWEKEGVVYIPLPYTKFNTPLTQGAVRTMLSDAGYQFARKPGVSYETIEALAEKLAEKGALGRTRNISKEDFDPSVLLLRRARRAAQKHADTATEDALIRATGVPSTVPDSKKLNELNAKLDRLLPKLRKVEAKDEAYYIRQHQAEVQRRTQSRMNQYGNRAIEKIRQTQPANRQAASIRRITEHHQRKAFEDASAAIIKEQTKDREALARYQKSFDKIKSDIRRAVAQKNPVLSTEPFKGYTKHPRNKVMWTDFDFQPLDPESIAPVKHTYHVPQAVAEMLARKEMLVNTSEELQAFESTLGKIMSTWKMGVTVINPGYRVRNTLSDMWAQWLLGMNPAQMTRYWAKSARLMARARKGDKAARKILNDAYDQGVLSGFFGGDVHQISRAVNRGGGYRAAALKGKRPTPAKLGVKAMSDMNKYVENQARLATYLWKLDKTGDSVKAAEIVRFGHFDYEDLTDVEREKFKKIIPFYTWMRKNIPYQVASLATSPGRYSAFPKFVMEMEEAADGTEGEYVPEFLREQMGFKVPGTGYMIPPIGALDLLSIQNPSRILEGIGPQFQVPLELATNREFPSFNPIEGKHPRNPISDEAGALFSLIPGADVGVTERFVNGQEMQGTGADPRVGWLARQLPWANYLVNNRSSIKEAQRGPQVGGIPGFLSGITSFTPDQDQGELVAQIQWNDEIAKIIRGMRDENLLPESEEVSESEYQQRINALIRQLYTR